MIRAIDPPELNEYNDILRLPRTLNQKGGLLEKQGDLKNAIIVHKEELEELDKMLATNSNYRQRAVALDCLARLHLKLKEFDKA